MTNYENVEINSERWFDLTPLLNEEFEDIKDYEELYQVSNYGRVKSTRNNIILKCCINNYDYLTCWLSINGKSKNCQIHRLVAETFIPNLNNKPTVNHISGNKHDNRVCNLEWNTYSEQLNHSYKNNLREKPFGNKNNMFNKKGKLHHRSKPVYQCNSDGKIIKVWENTYEIVKKLNFTQSGINRCCLGKMKTYKGFIWKY